MSWLPNLPFTELPPAALAPTQCPPSPSGSGEDPKPHKGWGCAEEMSIMVLSTCGHGQPKGLGSLREAGQSWQCPLAWLGWVYLGSDGCSEEEGAPSSRRMVIPTPLSSVLCSAHLPFWFLGCFLGGSCSRFGVQGLLFPPPKFPPAAR